MFEALGKMDRRERILAKGYLIKSPVKNTEKSSFARFWKLRWLVLTEVLLVDVNESMEESKLVFSYYKDKDSHAKDEQPKGILNISQCQSIKSCFQPQANFDHVFVIEFNDGKVVRFSAPSCEKKFKWVSLLHKYRFNSNIGEFMSAVGIQGASPNRQSNGQNRSSICSIGRPSSFARNHNGYRNSSFDGSSEDPPPLPPRRQSTASGNSIRLADGDRSSIRSALNPSEIDIDMLQIFNDLFMFCSKCQSEKQKRSSIQRKKRGSKKWNGQDEDVELRNESTMPSHSKNDGDTISQFSNTSDDFFVEDSCDLYSKIDDILLEKVKDLKEKAERINEGQEEEKSEPKKEEDAGKDKKETEDFVGEGLNLEDQTKGEEKPMEDEVYVAMNQVDAASILQTSFEQETTDVIQVPADAQRDRQEALSNNVCPSENLQEYFEMSF